MFETLDPCLWAYPDITNIWWDTERKAVGIPLVRRRGRSILQQQAQLPAHCRLLPLLPLEELDTIIRTDMGVFLR